ncbi:MAG: ATP-binding cassette domain-containing protein [Acholeplasma sp.]|nr:ATP-binding cassette domain-containing protein [Acholeplasma sp.]
MITFIQVKKTYRMKQHVIHALDGITFKTGKNSLVSIVGPSGCGKTTCLNMIGGLDQPDSGTFLYNGIDTASFSEQDWNEYRNQTIGFVFQSFFLIPHLTVLENVMMPLKLSGHFNNEAEKIAKKALKDVNLSAYSNHKPAQLSGGQQQKVAIARALINEPDIILADEPTGSLDEKSSIEVMMILKKISETKLVIMVTHNLTLALNYSDHILSMNNGQVIKDEVIHKNQTIKHANKPDKKQSRMSFMTAFKLSFSNLTNRAFRTLLIGLAASIGVLGMTLVLSVSNGFNRFLDIRRTETLNAFPIRVEKYSLVVPFFDKDYQPDLPLFSNESVLYPRNIQYEFTTINTLTPDYYEHIKQMDTNLFTHLHYDYEATHTFLSNNGFSLRQTTTTFYELPVSHDYLSDNFDVLEGRLPNDDQNEMVVILDRYNRLSKEFTENIGYENMDSLSFEDLLNLTVYWIPNQVKYTKTNGLYVSNNPLALDPTQFNPIKVVGVIRVKDKFNLDLINSGLYYTNHLGNTMRNEALSSSVVSEQLSSNTSVFDGSTLTPSLKNQLLKSLGYAAYPTGYTVYSSTFDAKDEILTYLKRYNDSVSSNLSVEPLDLAGIGLSTMRTAIDSMTTILLVFSALSIIISNLMLGIITYNSVTERIKEIGILRAIGARKKDIKTIFYAETMIIGFISGVTGVCSAYLFSPLLDVLLKGLTTVDNVTYLPILYGCLIILINIFITALSGWIPARIAANKDPIQCLNTSQ